MTIGATKPVGSRVLGSARRRPGLREAIIRWCPSSSWTLRWWPSRWIFPLRLKASVSPSPCDHARTVRSAAIIGSSALPVTSACWGAWLLASVARSCASLTLSFHCHGAGRSRPGEGIIEQRLSGGFTHCLQLDHALLPVYTAEWGQTHGQHRELSCSVRPRVRPLGRSNS